MSKMTENAAPRLVHIDGVAYDVEAWAKKHPGGEVMLRFLGRDATAAFVAFHGRKTRRTLQPFRAKGEVGAPPPAELEMPVEREFDALRLAAEQRGQFAGRHSFFVGRLSVILGLIASSSRGMSTTSSRHARRASFRCCARIS